MGEEEKEKRAEIIKKRFSGIRLKACADETRDEKEGRTREGSKGRVEDQSQFNRMSGKANN